MENNQYPFVNLPLPYDYDALEPFIDEKTMRLHHDRHLQTYIDNLNKILESNDPSLRKLSLERLICGNFRIPLADREAIKNNAGGIYNHRFFFCGMRPDRTRPGGSLKKAIENTFGSMDHFYIAFKKAALSVFGSGYAWLVKRHGDLKIIKTVNQDTPLCQGCCPIITVDVWEHAYYLKHYNLRGDYIEDWFKVIDWDTAQLNYESNKK